MKEYKGVQHFDGKFLKLNDVVLEKPDKDAIVLALKDIDKRLVASKDGKEAVQVIRDYFALEDDIATTFDLIYIRHSIDTRDEYYSSLNKWMDENSPEIQNADHQVQEHFLSCPFRKDLEDAFGTLIFEKAKLSSKTFKPEIMEDLGKENSLVSSYIELTGKALISYKGKEYSLPQMGKFTTSPNREVRKEASTLVWNFYKDNEEKIGKIYDDMVKVRTKIARTLGYKNFLQLAYDRMGRLDWTPADAKIYREKIKKYIVPLSEKIFTDQAKRVLPEGGMKFYDWVIFYKTGNPKPQGDIKTLVEAASRMYKEMSPVASKYFDFMVDHGCLDLEAKPGKGPGGYMEYIPGLKTSFIFSNANGTSGDVEVLTHEFGHSLQGFLGGDIEVPDYRAPGYECCEMHSMSMEYLTYPWMKYFFKQDTDKFLYQHLCDAITFIPYGAIVDAFQTYAYENPDKTPAEREAYWRELEKEYLPHRTYEGNDFLERGGYWMRQPHIFENPIYYLDYTIAQVVSLEFFLASEKDWQKTFDKYIAFDKLAGRYPFRSLLAKAGIENPMDNDTLEEVSRGVMEYLSKFSPEEIDK